MAGAHVQYESRARPAPIWPSPLWVMVGIILPLVAGPGLLAISAALSGLPLPGMGNPTMRKLVHWVAFILGVAGVLLPIVLFLRGIMLTIRRRSPLGYGLGIGLLLGSGINLALLVALGWYFWNNPLFYPA